MPIYEYECTSCCHAFEVFQRMTEEPLNSCPECSGSVKKLMSKSSFQLKGGGWYADGYSSASCNNSGAAKNSKATENGTGAGEKKASSTPDSSTAKKNKESCSAAT